MRGNETEVNSDNEERGSGKRSQVVRGKRVILVTVKTRDIALAKSGFRV
jgi:hypothetical protein